MASKTDKELAYEAGRNVMTEPPERRSVEACPFSPLDHPDEHAAWLEGFADALDEQQDIASLRKAVASARSKHA